MTDVVRLCTQAAFDNAYLCGGWASVRLMGQESSGFAGGARRTTRRRMLLAGLGGGMKGLPPAVGVLIEIDGVDAEAMAAILAGDAPGPEEDLDLWAPILTACRGRLVTVMAAIAGPDTPMAFARAWAEFSSNKAKAKGPFTATIPRANVTKLVWPRQAGTPG